MAEVASNVYDIVHPAPVTLVELSAITVSIEIWRCEVNKYRSNLKKFKPNRCEIALKTALPDLPSTICNLIEKYVKRFKPSMENWINCHYERVFKYHHHHPNSILEYFTDFAADCDGTIDYVRTAERMMLCDKICEPDKFIIACTYFFKDHIKRIWRSLEGNISLKGLTLSESPQLYYWVCYLKKELNKIKPKSKQIIEVMFDNSMRYNRPSVEYFWFKIPLNRQFGKAVELFERDVESFVRFILPKLDDQRLEKFQDSVGCEFILSLWKKHFCCARFIPHIWKYTKNKTNVDTLINLIEGMLELEAVAFEENLTEEPENWLYFCSEFWNDITPDLKQSIVVNILSDARLFERMRSAIDDCRSDRRFVGFLLIILSSASFEQRNSFWQNCWSHLILGTLPEDLQQIMSLCFENQSDDQQFDMFVNDEGCKWIATLWKNHFCCKRFVLPTWRYIGHKMNTNTLTHLIECMLRREAMAFEENLREEPENWSYFCSELWNDIAPELKQSIVANILSDVRLFENNMRGLPVRSSDRRFVGFLLIILSSATFEQKNTFWQNCWSHLISGTRLKDLQQIMNLCYENESEIAEFKSNIMSESGEGRRRCISLLIDARFYELNTLADFCFPEVQEARNFKQQILRSAFIDQDRCLSVQLCKELEKVRSFIRNAFDNPAQRANFENQLMSTPSVRRVSSINRYSFTYYDVLKSYDFFGPIIRMEDLVSSLTCEIDLVKQML